MANIICKIFIGNGVLDDDYTFFDDGTIKREYDQNTFKLNLEDFLDHNQISEHKKKKIIEKCPINLTEQITKILYPNG